MTRRIGPFFRQGTSGPVSFLSSKWHQGWGGVRLGGMSTGSWLLPSPTTLGYGAERRPLRAPRPSATMGNDREQPVDGRCVVRSWIAPATAGTLTPYRNPIPTTTNIGIWEHPPCPLESPREQRFADNEPKPHHSYESVASVPHFGGSYSQGTSTRPSWSQDSRVRALGRDHP